MTNKELEILRNLASNIAEIAQLDIHNKTREDWKALHSLKPNRPMFMLTQYPWHEMNVDDELTNLCEDSFCTMLETNMRRTLYVWKHIKDDTVIEPYFNIPIPIKGRLATFTGYDILNYGIEIKEHTASIDSSSDVRSHIYHDQLESESDLVKLTKPIISIDQQRLQEYKEKSDQIFEGIMPYKMKGIELGFQLWDFIVEYRGAEICLYDLIDRPEFLHKILKRMTDISLYLIDTFENLGIIAEHSELAFADCCAAYTYDKHIIEEGKITTAKNAWTFGMSQIFSSVSKEMHEEFEYDYLEPMFKRFGNVYYGCCEPLDNKIDMIRKYSNVRKVSMSPWANIKLAAERLSSDFVLSRKPNPASFAGSSCNFDFIEKEIIETQQACKSTNTPVEYLLKDISTVNYEPQRLWEWSKRIRKIIN